ncbi:MAG TPA: hypothetical protein VHV08_07255, partial [Pirellulales bacterium]|nr:hypothetical protein [Pirellulales bacterium]
MKTFCRLRDQWGDHQELRCAGGFVLMGCLLAVCLNIRWPAMAFAQNRPRLATEDNLLSDVVAAVESVAGEGKVLTFDRGAAQIAAGGHFQGIQARYDAAANRQVVFLSHDSATVAYLAIVEFAPDFNGDGRLAHLHQFPSDGALPPLRHAGGIQLLGDILVVGLEDNQQKTRSEIQFWDTSALGHLAPLRHLTIRRHGEPKAKTAGAVGIIERMGDCLLAVANWDSRAIDFYLSNGKPLKDADCRFELSASWQVEKADRADWRPDAEFSTYQSVNLVSNANRDVFLAGFDTTAAGRDYVDLF